MKFVHYIIFSRRFLVLDEADRMINQMENDWLSLLEKSVCQNRANYTHLNIKSISQPCVPFQKLLFSATLSGNAENLSVFHLFHPRLYVISKTKKPVSENTCVEIDCNDKKLDNKPGEKRTRTDQKNDQPKKLLKSAFDRESSDKIKADQDFVLEKYATPALLQVFFWFFLSSMY